MPNQDKARECHAPFGTVWSPASLCSLTPPPWTAAAGRGAGRLAVRRRCPAGRRHRAAAGSDRRRRRGSSSSSNCACQAHPCCGRGAARERRRLSVPRRVDGAQRALQAVHRPSRTSPDRPSVNRGAVDPPRLGAAANEGSVRMTALACVVLLLAAHSPACLPHPCIPPAACLQRQPVPLLPSGAPGGAALVCGSHGRREAALRRRSPGGVAALPHGCEDSDEWVCGEDSPAALRPHRLLTTGTVSRLPLQRPRAALPLHD